MRRFVKILSLFTAAVMLCALLPCTAFAATSSGTCGDNLTWTLNSSGTLTISGTGGMYDWDYSSTAPWYSYRSSVKSVVIESGATSIGNHAFSSCYNLTGITIGSGVTSIGNSAFEYCDSLTGITIPDSVTSIGKCAFYRCHKLTRIGVSEDSLYYSSVDGVLFDKEKTKLIKYPAKKTATEYKIPEGVTSIGEYAFEWCDSLTGITIPDGVMGIGDYAFGWCDSLVSMEIPDSVTSIGEYAFGWCDGLTSIDVSDANLYYSSVDGVLFDKEKTKLIKYPAKKTATEYKIPESVMNIGDYVFDNCSSLVSIEIPDGVTSIGECAFFDCGSLVGMEIPDSVTNIGEYAFCNCSNLTRVTIGDSMTSIGENAFALCDNLTSIDVSDANLYYSSVDGILFDKEKTKLIKYPAKKTATEYKIPEGVTSIGDSAFERCSNLTSITIPDSVTSIEEYAFEWCSNLTSVTIGNSVTSIGEYAFFDCGSLVGMEIPDSVTSIEDSAFEMCSNLTSVTIGNSVTSIGNYAFDYCSSLTSITIPDSVTSIGSSAFYKCSSLTSITIGDGVTSIGECAFGWCDSLVSMEIPDSVTSIEEYAFYRCNALTDVYYGSSEEDWNNISIGEYNTPLESATIHYNSSMPEPEIIASGELEEGISWALDEEGVFTMTAEETLSEYSPVSIGYSNDGEMKQSAVINGESAKMNTEGVKLVKIFIWESIESMKPVCEAYTIEIEK